jgi:hypothetical protein
MAGVSLYKPASPVAHSYLDHPLHLVWSVNIAVLADLMSTVAGTAQGIRLAAVIGLTGLGTSTLKPEFSMIGPSLRAWRVLASVGEPAEAPPGYCRGSVGPSAFYPWSDYRALLAYLRRSTSPTTRVANALKGEPAVTAAVDRPSAFPAEAIPWIRMVRPDDQEAFAESLARADDSVVVWAPGEPGFDPDFSIARIEAVVRRLYRPEARFGVIEVWRRRDDARSGPVSPLYGPRPPGATRFRRPPKGRELRSRSGSVGRCEVSRSRARPRSLTSVEEDSFYRSRPCDNDG